MFFCDGGAEGVRADLQHGDGDEVFLQERGVGINIHFRQAVGQFFFERGEMRFGLAAQAAIFAGVEGNSKQEALHLRVGDWKSHLPLQSRPSPTVSPSRRRSASQALARFQPLKAEIEPEELAALGDQFEGAE